MEQDLVVVGSGISGMSFAHYAAKSGLRPLVVEKNCSPGGCICSQRLQSGFWFELGAHTCYNGYRTLIDILDQRNLLGTLIKREKVPFRVLSNGAVRPITKELHILELLFSARRLLTSNKTGKSVRSYYSRLVGARNYDRVFGPLFAAVPSQKADDFPADMLFKRRTRRKDIPRSFTMAGGLQAIIDSIAGDTAITLRFGVEVTSIRREPGALSLTLADGSGCRARHVALAVPPPEAAALLAPDFPAIAAALSRIKASPMHTFGVVVRKEATPIEPVAGIIPLDDRFFSVVSRDTVPDPNWRGFAFHSRPGISHDDMLRQATGLLKIDRGAIEHVFERDALLPSPVLGHQQVVQAINEQIAHTPLFITGNYFGGLAIEDCVIRSKEEFARLMERS